MLPPSDLFIRFGERMLVWRWGIMTAIGTSLTMFEIGEHRLFQFADISAEVVSEILFFGIFFPALGGLSLTWIARTKSQHTFLLDHLEKARSFTQQLANTTDWDDLMSLAIEIPKSIIPGSAVQLSVYNEISASFELAAESGVDEMQALTQPGLAPCSAHLPYNSDATQKLIPCSCLTHTAIDQMNTLYCLPLVHGSQTNALLNFYISKNQIISPEQAAFIDALAPDLAHAIERARLQRSLILQSSIAVEERRRIAQDLHDTVGHDLAFVRLKLDELTLDRRSIDPNNLHDELMRLQESVNSAYENVRGALKSIFQDMSMDLTSDIREIARKIALRSHLDIAVISEGTALIVPRHERRQVFLIIKEILSNIEKHAQAKHVEIYLNWASDGVQIKAVDDGIGFMPDQSDLTGHYGLKLMQQRAEEINAELTVKTLPGAGTQTLLWLPISLMQ